MALNTTECSNDKTARREAREAQRRYRDLLRQSKEMSRLSQLQQARLEVETYESHIAVLLSVHKEQSEPWDWKAIRATLLPPSPCEFPRRQLKVAQAGRVDLLEEARSDDLREWKSAVEQHSAQTLESTKMRNFAQRILAGDAKAYTTAVAEFSALREISELGSEFTFTVHDPNLVEFKLCVNGITIIPSEVKSLTATGKLSIKTMPKGQFHELYQDYICSCVLRVAREIFAILPATTVLITAATEENEGKPGNRNYIPVLSVAITRSALQELPLERLEPSQAVEQFSHRGDFKADRNSGAFRSIIPLNPKDFSTNRLNEPDLATLQLSLRNLKAQIGSEFLEISKRVAQPEEPSEST